jgi:hypothetical protein
MTIDKGLEQELVRFKRYRDEMVHADSGELEHHLREFVRELARNSLVKAVRGDLPGFDPEAWWEANVNGPMSAEGNWRLDAIAFPDDDAERLVVLLDLAESMASGDRKKLSISGLGGLFGKTKFSDAAATATSVVLRPLAELLGEKVRSRVEAANPAVRELAGIPLNLIPADGETVIFLSHKSVDKPRVRPYYDLLSELGLDPWLDERDMKAGDTLHREIADGFDRSCAVVFFITPHFDDERWLAREIDHAIHRKIERGAKFSIITLVYEDAVVPRSLKEFIWVNVVGEVDATREVLRALPIRLGPARWRK